MRRDRHTVHNHGGAALKQKSVLGVRTRPTRRRLFKNKVSLVRYIGDLDPRLLFFPIVIVSTERS